MHKVFISYHHHNDQRQKESLVQWGEQNGIFIDRSVDTGDISDELSDERIREKIRDEYLRDTTVTILLVGEETRHRKHVDWEIYSSMYDGPVNKRSGIVVINLPGLPDSYRAAYGDGEKNLLYPTVKSWTAINERAEYKHRYPHMPDRIIDNFMKSNVRISVAPWEKINRESLTFLIESAFNNRLNCQYDLSSPIRRANS